VRSTAKSRRVNHSDGWLNSPSVSISVVASVSSSTRDSSGYARVHRTDTTAQAPVSTHEHSWLTESRHATSEGTVRYVQCPECAARRVDLQRYPDAPPVATSQVTADAHRDRRRQHPVEHTRCWERL